MPAGATRRSSASALASLVFVVVAPLVLVALVLPGCRKEQDTAKRSPQPVGAWFEEITSDDGFEFVHVSGEPEDLHAPRVMGAGGAMFDFDGDHDLDLYLINGHRSLPSTAGSTRFSNRLFRQESSGKFVDVTDGSGLADGGYGMGVAIGDYDNDGDRDVLVTNVGPDHLYRNRGDGTFEDVTTAAGIDLPGWSCSAGFFDYDRDGFLDLFVTQYVSYKPELACVDRAGKPEFCGPMSFPPQRDVLLHNEGDGTFKDVSKVSGIASVAAAGLGVVFEDLNGDGWIDIYVANDGYANNLWINGQDGTFSDEAFLLGVAFNAMGQAEAGMGVLVGDFDNDAEFDLFVTHLNQESNTLYRNLGGNTGFSDVTGTAGLSASSMAYTGFGTAALDFEQDGDLDIIVVNGRVVRFGAPPQPGYTGAFAHLPEPNLCYVNDGTGRFQSAGEVAAVVAAPLEISRGLALGDLDNDGDDDLLITNCGGRARLYRNVTPHPGHWLTIRALDPRYNRDALGATVRLVAGPRLWLRAITRTGSYLSSCDPRARFGLGTLTAVEYAEVRWPDGLRERFAIGGVDRQLTLTRGAGTPQP